MEVAEPIDSKEFMNTVWQAVTKLYGEYGASRAGLVLIDYRMEERFAVIRVSLSALEMVRASLASITKVGNKAVAIHVLMVSGTLKALYRKVRGKQSLLLLL